MTRLRIFRPKDRLPLDDALSLLHRRYLDARDQAQADGDIMTADRFERRLWAVAGLIGHRATQSAREWDAARLREGRGELYDRY